MAPYRTTDNDAGFEPVTHELCEDGRVHDFPREAPARTEARFRKEQAEALAKDEHDRQFTAAVDYVQGLLK